MDIYPEDFWMTYKNSWAPKPGWLSTDVASLASRRQPVREVAQSRCQGDAAGAADFSNDATGSSEAGEDRPVFVERRKKKPVSSISGPSRTGSTPSARRLEANNSARKLRVRCVPVQDTDLLRAAGEQSRKIDVDNVVALRPRPRDYTYADYVLSALRSMFEAQAAGQKELLMARIKLVSHLLEDIGRRRQE